MPFRYSLFGLVIDSVIELPELRAQVGGAAADVVVAQGAIDPGECGLGYAERSDGTLFHAPGVAAFLVTDGNRITIAPQAGAVDRDIRLFLLGSAFGALLHQRGLLPIHGNAIEIDGRAVIVMGASGAGKSTMAAWFADRGFRVLADDVSVVGIDPSGSAFVSPGVPRLRLWQDALDHLGRSSAGLERSFAGADEHKFDLPVQTAKVGAGRAPLRALYALSQGKAVTIKPLTGVAAADPVFAHTYRGALAATSARAQTHWQSAVALIRAVPTFELARPWDHALLDTVGDALIAHARTFD